MIERNFRFPSTIYVQAKSYTMRYFSKHSLGYCVSELIVPFNAPIPRAPQLSAIGI